MTTEEKKEGEFDPACVCDIRDKFVGHNFALRALGALLRTSGLSDFADEALDCQNEPKRNLDADNLRWGLSQIIDLYLDHQEKILTEYCDQYNESDINLTQRAEVNLGMVEHDAFRTREAMAESLRETLMRLDIVINRGGELKEKAAALKEKGMKYLKRVTEKEAAGGAEKTA